MSEEHPNVSLLKRVDLGNLASCADLFTEDFVWRIVAGRLTEAWDIPAINTARPQTS